MSTLEDKSETAGTSKASVATSVTMSGTYSVLTGQRRIYRGNVTRYCNSIDQADNLDEPNRKFYSNKLLDLKKKLTDVDSRILAHILEHNLLSEDELSALEVQCCEYLDRLEWNLVKLSVVDTPRAHGSSDNFENRIKLPPVDLPEYNHEDGDQLEKFLFNFETTIAQHPMSDFTKFSLLKKSLRGHALTLIKSLDVKQQSYQEAKKLLMDAFASPVKQKSETMKRLAQLNLNDDGDPFQFVAEVKTLINLFENLKISVNDVLNYFIFKALNDKLRRQLVLICNQTYPSLEQINDNLFNAIDRANQEKSLSTFSSSSSGDKSNKSISKSISNNAVNIKAYIDSKPSCPLCSHDKANADHNLKNCPRYETPADRFSKLKSV
mgnify:CR=1 FL=1